MSRSSTPLQATGAAAAVPLAREAVNEGRISAPARNALLAHPNDADAAVLTAQLRRLGWQVQQAWPLPADAPAPGTLVIVAIDDHNLAEVGRWLLGHEGVALGVLLSQHVRLVEKLGDLGLVGVLSRPLRLLALQAQIEVAEAQMAWVRRLQRKAAHLEVQLRARRTIEHATRILMVARDLGAESAYELLRSRAMSERRAITDMASEIIERAQDC